MADIPAGLLVVCGCSTALPLATPGLGLPMCTVWHFCFSVWPPHFHLRKLYKQCVWQSAPWGSLPRGLCASWDGWQVTVEMYQNWSCYCGLIILLILLQLSSVLCILYSRWKFPWLHGRRGSWCSLWRCVCVHACVHVCRTRRECWGLMRHPYEAWGHLLINILMRH